MGILIEDSTLRDRRQIFNNRADAGGMLAARLNHYRGSDALVLAIPSGGVPVAAEIAVALSLPLDLIVARKVQVPFNTEVGFGAMDPDGGVFVDELFLRRLSLPPDVVRQQVEKTRKVIDERNRIFREGRPFPSLENKIVILVDDGLATGNTLRVAVRYVVKKNPLKTVAVVPTGSRSSVEEMLPEVDELVCLNVRSGYPYAVAEAYKEWHDVRDEEVLAVIGKERERERQRNASYSNKRAV
jgi:predicted phosphoribosyltransferase